jgi:hypothetical protein
MKDNIMIEKINKVLYNTWNPIGVSNLPEKEYFSYAKNISEAYSGNNNSATDIAEYLLYVENNILLCGSKSRILSAEKISKILLS